MEQYIVIGKRIEERKDKFEDYRIQKYVDSVTLTSPPTPLPAQRNIDYANKYEYERQ